ncbi:MAG: hypothetical protein BZ138_08275 [Methanosphaera sp. rholeuAM270]|nr:MAG: hypothetical protein BZ138_08275 [Methanosphaera sp. rholeuAM270]
MKSKSMKIMAFLTVVLLTIMFMGMVCATTTDNNMDTSGVDAIPDVTQSNHDKQATVNNAEIGIKSDDNGKINGADTTTKTINKDTDNTASKTVSINVTYSGEDTDTYEKVKNLIETNDDAQELIIELNKDKTYTITEPITFGTQTNTKTLTINGCNAIIDGNKTQSFITVLSGYTLNLNTITIQNTRSDNGAAIYSDGTVNINDATFKDNSALYRGCAVYSSGTLTVNRTQFTDNKVTTTKNALEKDYGGGAILAKGTLSVDNSSFNGNKAEYDTAGTLWDAGIGGAILIYNNTDDVSITNSQFTENKANYGGAIKIYDPQNRNKGNIVIDSNVFNKNRADEGGALSLEHSTIVTNNNFIENVLNKLKVNLPSIGGAIVIYDEKIEKTYTLTLSDNIFNANDAGNIGYGGAVVSIGMIQNSSRNVFENNKALYGGAIFNLGNATSVDDIFTDNSALYRGGAICNSGNATVTNDTFTNNNALYTGGAIDSFGTLTVTESKFNNNKVTTIKDAAKNDYSGGAILSGGPLSIDKSLFAGNVAAHDDSGSEYDSAIGGAVYVFNCTYDVSITNNNFTENDAGYGGAIGVYDPQYRDEGNVLIDSNNFIENLAYQGGTLSLQHSANITNNNFTENMINDKNSNIYPMGAAIHLYDEKKETTYTLTVSDNTFKGNDVGKQGIGGSIRISEGMILDSKNNTYENNKAAYGGAIFNEGNLTVTDDTFTNNTALYKGGAIYSYETLTVTESKFNNNRVTTTKNAIEKDYGGAAILARGVLSVDNSSFNGNIVEYDTAGTMWDAGIGGAILIYNNTDDVSITNSQFTANEAGYGGAVMAYDPLYRDEGNIVIDSNVFNKNHAYQGGALSLQHSTIVTNNNFTENMINQIINAPIAGAAIIIYDDQYEKTYTLTLSDNIFNANDAGNKGYGGAIWIDRDMILYSTGNIYENNKARYGGAISNIGNATSADDIFTENSAVYRGGAVFTEGTLNVNSSQFIDNKVTTSKNATKEDYGGGAIFTTSTLTVDNSVFRANVATHDNIESTDDGGPAGAIHIFNNTDVVSITNSNFTENNAAISGVINIYDPLYRNEGKILIDNNIFNKNYAIQGGAISALQPVNITNNKFIKNYVYYDENYINPTSGAILLYNPFEMNEFTVNLINNTFSENSAEDRGDSGAICVSDKILLNSKNNIYENNKAVEGGVMLNIASATFTDDIFTGNTATDGGVFANKGNLTINNCTFKDNTATEYGDFAYTEKNMTITDSTINTDNLERLITAYADIFASNNTVNDEFLEERLINSTITLEKRDLILNKENNITGTLIDATDVPIVKATVYLYVDGRYDSSAVTDENGVFTFKYTPRNGTNATLSALFYPGNYYLISYSEPVEVKIVNNDTNNTPQPKPAPKVKPTTTKTTKNAKKITQSNTHTIRLARDNTLIYTGNALTLEALNKIFDHNFTNGHLLVYIDGVLVFNQTTTDDITTVILELLDKYLGEHEIKVVFTDNQNHTDTYKENITIR